MSDIYTGNSSNLTPPLDEDEIETVLPEDGDPLDAASVRVAMEFMLDVEDYLNEGGQPLEVHDHWHRNDWEVDHTTWTYGYTGVGWGPSQITSNTQTGLPLDLPNGCTLNSVTVYIKPAGGHGGEPTKPSFKVFRLNPGTGVETQLGSTSTDTTTLPSYENLHAMPAVSGLAHFVDKQTYRYYITFTGEAGGQYQNGLRIVGVNVQFTTTGRDTGAA